MCYFVRLGIPDFKHFACHFFKVTLFQDIIFISFVFAPQKGKFFRIKVRKNCSDEKKFRILGIRNKGKNMIQEFTAAKKSGRLDSFLSEQTGISRSKIKKHIENGKVSVNGTVCADPAQKLSERDTVCFSAEEEQNTLQAAQSDLVIHYRDEYLAVIEKKPYLTVHPCPSCQEETLVHHLLYHFPSLRKMEGERPGIVHRLDKDTSGLMLVALTEECRLKLSEAFCEKEVRKTYLALVQGICPDGESRESIGRHPSLKTKMAVVPANKGGREAFSEWERIYPAEIPQNSVQSENFSLMKVKIHTGRTHQIRVHLSSFGYPLLGDELYAPQQTAQKAPRQMLHAYQLVFRHPFTQETLSFTSLPPEDFWACFKEQIQNREKGLSFIVTGNPGCGKSALTETAARKNFPTFSADRCISELYQVNGDAWYLLKQQYGSRFVPDEKKPVCKTSLAQALKDSRMKQELENLLHPLVYAQMQAFFRENEHKNAVAEIPLWFEHKPQKLCFKSIVLCVTCDESVRIKRLHERGWTDETIAFMDSVQLTQREKAKLADFCIENSSSLEHLEKEFCGILERLENEKTDSAENIIQKIKKRLESVS